MTSPATVPRDELEATLRPYEDTPDQKLAVLGEISAEYSADVRRGAGKYF
jgi:hypothetical protein